MLLCFKPLGKILHDMLMMIGAILNDPTMTCAKRTGIAVEFPDNGHYVPKPTACLRQREALSELKTVQCYKIERWAKTKFYLLHLRIRQIEFRKVNDNS